MSTLLDDRIGIKKETVYNTPVVVDRFYPYLEGTEGAWDVRRRQSMGLQGGTGRRAYLASRSALPIGQGKVTVKVELESKAAGVLLDLAFGVSTLTAITGGSQQLFHPGLTTPLLPSATIQIVKVRNDGTDWVETYAGCTSSKVTIEQPEDAIPTLTVEFDARSISTATGAATPVYATAPVQFDAWQATSVGFGGTLTVPSTTILGTGPTASTDFVSWKYELDQQIDDKDWILGGRQQPYAGIPKQTFTAKANFNTASILTAYLAGTKMAFQSTWTTTETLGAGFTQGQLSFPALAIDGDMPKVKPGETREIDLKMAVVNDGTNRDVYFAYRTTDTVL
jgi:Phage tail tube protein